MPVLFYLGGGTEHVEHFEVLALRSGEHQHNLNTAEPETVKVTRSMHMLICRSGKV